MPGAPCEAKTPELFEAAGTGVPIESEAAAQYRVRLRKHNRDIIAVVILQVAIALVLVPCAQLADRLHPIFAAFVGVVLGVVILIGFRLLPLALNNLAYTAATIDESATLV